MDEVLKIALERPLPEVADEEPTAIPAILRRRNSSVSASVGMTSEKPA